MEYKKLRIDLVPENYRVLLALLNKQTTRSHQELRARQHIEMVQNVRISPAIHQKAEKILAERLIPPVSIDEFRGFMKEMALLTDPFNGPILQICAYKKVELGGSIFYVFDLEEWEDPFDTEEIIPPEYVKNRE